LNITFYLFLKYIHKNKINLFIKSFTNYIIKSKFFITFYKAYNKIFLNKNIKSAFRKAKILL
ncbi:hypothetical protein CORC01_00199, partial [Colletotrichum orchidophilum]